MKHAFASMSLIALGALVLGAASAQAGTPCHGAHCYKLVETPPAFRHVAEEVMVRPPQRVARHVPAQFETVTETVTIRPARTVAHHVPARYAVEAETVMIAPARKVWQVSVNMFGEKVGCWVDVPAQYATRHRHVRVRDARLVHETIPAIHAERSRAVMVRPPTIEYDVVPPVYRTRHRQVMVHPGSKAWAPVRSY
ncbi:MAG: hypothetical protein HEQ16_05915 [Bosea sp.]|jgi:hypothetical protein|nr:hypothetical protein [Bosea sp. (in: a-proteobacteria)]